MVGEWTAVYQKAWEKCRGNGLAVWHERNDGADGSDESTGDGPNQLTPIQIYDVDESDSEEALGCGQCYACVSGGQALAIQPIGLNQLNLSRGLRPLLNHRQAFQSWFPLWTFSHAQQLVVE